MKEYKLYRTLYDIIHPTISRKNIANYKILIADDLIPLKIYYPKKEIEIKEIIIYIADKISNNNIYTELAKRTDNLVLVIDYNNKNDIKNYYKTINYIYKNISSVNISQSNITIMSDYYGTTIEKQILEEARKKESFTINKVILLQPTLISNDSKIFNQNNSLIIMEDDNKKSNYVKAYLNKFIKGNDLATNEQIFSIINAFLKENML